jgi:AcrR family transcriptional regulator
VYRYFPGTDALLVATAMRSADGFLDQLAAHLRGYAEPVAAMSEGVAFAVETLADDDKIGFLLSHRHRGHAAASVTSDTALTFGRSMLHRFDVDWAAHGFDDDALNELAEFGIRALHSLLLDPGSPPRRGAQLRSFLTRWLGPTIAYPLLQRAMAPLAPQVRTPGRRSAS